MEWFDLLDGETSKKEILSRDQDHLTGWGAQAKLKWMNGHNWFFSINQGMECDEHMSFYGLISWRTQTCQAY